MGEQHSDALFREVFEAAPDAVVIVDHRGDIVLANAQCRAVFDRSAEELVGQSIEVLVPERFRDGHPGRCAGFTADADPRPMGLLRLAGVRRDGTEFPAEISLAPIESDGQHYVSATIRDITPRIRDEERFRSLLEAAPDATVIVDASTRVVLTNNQVTPVLGWERGELVGQLLEVLVPERFREQYARFRDEFLASPSFRPMGVGMRLRALHHDGHELPVEVSVSPLETEEGVLISVAVRDVTERLRMQAESQRLRDELIATVSHELRTPLTAIIGYAELMADLDEADLGRRARRSVSISSSTSGSVTSA